MAAKSRPGVDLDDIRAAIDGRLAELRDEAARLMAAREALTSGRPTPTAATAAAEYVHPQKRTLAARGAGNPADDRPDRSGGNGLARPGDARAELAPAVMPHARTGSPQRQPPLTIELVPVTCWQSNVRDAVSRAVWNQLRHRVYADAGNRCEVCGGVGVRPALHCHEVWEYDDERHVQRLVRLVALCPSCHGVKHIGRTTALGYGSDALRQLAKVNQWTPEQASAYAAAAVAQWRERSTHEWALDLDGLRAYGIDPATVTTPSATDRAARTRQRLPRSSHDTTARGSGTASSQVDAETGADFWLCDDCGRRGEAVLEAVAVTDAHPAIQDFLRRAPGRFKDEVTLVLTPSGWQQQGGRVICGSCAGSDPPL